MRILFRVVASLAMAGLVFNLALAQKSLQEIPESERGNLTKEGGRETHQGPLNPMQGSTSKRPGRFGGPDPYGPEGYAEFAEKNERLLNDPQCQLQIDMQDPKRIVVDYPDGTSREYWYVLFRVVNNNTRAVRTTTLPALNPDDASLASPASPLEVRTSLPGDIEGVPVVTHLDFELDVFTRDVERDPWDREWPADADEEVLSDQARAERRANIRRSYRAISDPYVLQRITQQEQMWEWAGNNAGMPEPISLLHPLSDFQRQAGRAFDLESGAPDLSGRRCLPERSVITHEGERTEVTRYVAVYGDNTFAGVYGEGDTLPTGARLVTEPSDPMWGKLTQRRYNLGDCVDRFGRALSANEPGYLGARAAGGESGAGSYGILREGNSAIGRPITIPHVRQYREGDAVLFNFDTGRAVAGRVGENWRLNGKLVSAADPRHDSAERIDSGTQKFGAAVVGKPVKLQDSYGRAIRRTIITYQPGDTITQAEWDIYRARLGPAVLARYQDLEGITDRPLTVHDPVVNLPRIKLGYFTGENSRNAPETLRRGIDTGRRGTQGEVILDVSDYETGRPYDPRVIEPSDFMRDPEGEFTTNRVAPVPPGAALNPGEEYSYAPLGKAGEGAVPVPRFDAYGAWMDYRDPISHSRIPLTDAEGKLVHDEQDQIQYLKDYELEYLYVHENAALEETDEGFKGRFGGDRWKLITEDVRMMFKDGNAVSPLLRLVFQPHEEKDPEILDGYETRESGQIRYLTAEEYAAATGGEPGPGVVRVKIIRSKTVTRDRVVGVTETGENLPAGARAETWEEAMTRAQEEGYTVQTVTVIRYINRFRTEFAVSGKNPITDGKAPTQSEFEEGTVQDNGLEGHTQTWRRWTVPPPMVFKDPASGEWQVISRLADKIGPATRWDGADAPRFTTRFVSEMWGAAIFSGVSRDWDWANVRVRGLRGHVAKAGLKLDTEVLDLPNPADPARREEKSFFNPRMTGEEWVYWVRYERLGDEFENFRDLIRRQRAVWFRESDKEVGE